MSNNATLDLSTVRAVLLVVIVVLGTVPMPAMGATTTDVTLSPSSQKTGVGETVTYDVVVTNASGGIGAWEFTASVDNASAAEITEVRLSGSPTEKNVSVSSDGSSAHAKAALADTANTGSVTIATITVRGVAEGSTGLSISVHAVGDEAGNNYQIASTPGATLTIENANFVYSDFSVTPTDANESANITATATVTNEGGTDGSILVPFYIDGQEVDAKNVTLAAGESSAVEFTHVLPQPGDYDVNIGQTTPVTVSVNALPEASVTAAPTDSGVNETITLDATGSTDDGSITSYEWDVGTGTIVDRGTGTVDVVFDEPGKHTIAATVTDDDGATDSASVTVNVSDQTGPTADFSVSEESVVIDGSVVLDASAASDNVGITSYEWTAEAPDGTTESLTGETAELNVTQNGNYSITLTVTDEAGQTDTATKEVEGLAPATFETSQAVNNRTLLTNESVSVNATVTNTGDVSGTTTVNLSVDGVVRDTKSVTLDAGSSTTVTFATTLTRGEHTVSINDNDPISVRVLAPANLSVQAVDAPAEVVQGAPAEVNITVENVGDTDGARDVSLTLGSQIVDTSVSVPAGETANVTLSVPTDDIPVGPTNYEVATGADSATGSVTILEPANTSISYALNTTEPLTNESLQVTATINNTGDVEGKAPVTLYVDDGAVSDKTVTIAGQSTETVTFVVNLSRGAHTVRVNDLAATEVTALAPPNLSVSYAVNTTTILTNESVKVTATVENKGDLTGSTSVDLTVNGTVVDSQTVTVNGTASKTVSYVPDLERGTQTVAVNGLDPTSVEVLKPADVNVIAQNVTTTEILSTDALNATVYLNNTGDLKGTTTVDLAVNGTVIATQTVTVPANTIGQSTNDLHAVNFSVTRNWEEYGAHTVGTPGLTPETIDVLRPTNPDATVSITSPTEGAVLNSSDGTVTITASNVSTGVAQIEVGIDGSWSTLESDSWDFSGLADGEHTAMVRVIDNLGNPISRANASFVVDTQAPTVAVKATGPVSSNAPGTVTVESSDLTPNSTVVEVRDGTTVVYRENVSDEVVASTAGENRAEISWDGTNMSGAALPSGSYTVAVVSTDQAGHTSEATTTVTVDTERPTVNVTDVSAGDGSGTELYVNGSDTIAVTLETSDATTNVTAANVVFQGTTSPFLTYASATETATDGTWETQFDVSNLGGSGNYSVGGLVTDEAQNTGLNTSTPFTIVVDEAAPNMGATISQADASTGRVNVTASETLTATPNATVYLPNGTTRSVPLSTSETGWTGTFEFGEDGTYRVSVTGTDRAGNTGQTKATTKVQTNVETVNRTATITNNETGTYIELHTEKDVNTAFAALTESDSPLAELSKNLTGAQFIDGQLGERLNDNLTYAVIGMPVNETRLADGVEPSDVEIRFYNESTGQWEAVGETTIEEHTFNGTTQRFYTVNVSHFSTYGAVAPDETAPSVGETSLSPMGSPYDYSTQSVDVQFNYSDPQTGVDTSAVNVWVDGQLVSDGGDFDGSLQVTNDQTTVTLADLVGSGDHSVTVQVVDEAGNVASNVSKTFMVTPDTTPPSLDTAYPTEQTLAYGTTEETISLDLSDTQSGINKSSITVTFDGKKVTGPATVTTNSVSYTGSGLAPGEHTMTVTVGDQEGNVETLTRTFTIADDTAKPTIDSTTLTPTPDQGLLSANTTSVTFETTYSDATSGVDARNVVVEFNDGSGWTDVTNTAVVTTEDATYTAYDLGPGTYTFRMTVPDAEGNIRTITKQVTIGSGTAPSIGTVSLSPTPDDETLAWNTSQVTLTVPFSDEQGDIETIDATLDGEPVTVTQSAGQLTYMATDLEAGMNHTFTVTLTDRGNHTVTRTVEFELAAKPSTGGSDSGNTGGGGGGGGGGGAREESATISFTRVESGATVSVRDAPGGNVIKQDLGDAISSNQMTLQSISVDMIFDVSQFRLEIATPTQSPQGVPALSADTAISYFEVNAIGLRTADHDGAQFTYQVATSALPDDTTMEDVVLYRYHDGSWQALETTHQGGGTFVADSSGFSTFAVGIAPSEETEQTETATETAETEPTETAATEKPTQNPETPTQTPESPTETSTPGFGWMVGMIALLLTAALLKRR